ncbi:adenosine 5'-monophosphoramidase HINT3-like [Rhynchophorus ferrugineus]|uniref:adenosine 5'-monophosphoramidase HINT3-like n=1 Tax=Rhynchophorus ferrugineus TaxID=354439 RepID=UPI003FCD2396
MFTTCVFCKIGRKEAEAAIKYESDDIVVFNDINPVARHHYLSVPKQHLRNVKSLNKAEHMNLLETMICGGKHVIEQEGGDLNDLRMGFHVPPFNTVDHLHLHLISPASSMSMFHNIMFKPNTWWFATASQIKGRLKQSIGESSTSNNDQ